MTENERKEISILEHMKNLVTVRTFEEEALEKAIQALEEIQRYRAIGTVEECRVAVGIVKKMYEHCEDSCVDCPYHNPNIPNKCMNDLLK